MLAWVINWFCGTKLWKWLVDKPMALLNFRLRGYTTFDITTYYDIVDLINADKATSDLPALYCFVSADKCTLGSWLIRKFTGATYSHAGVIIPGTYKECRIKHMTSTGFHSENPIALLKEVDLFTVVKYTFAAQQSYDLCMAKLGTIELNKPEYDAGLNLEEVKLYCSELVYTILCKRIILSPQGECLQLKPRLSFGKEVFTPDHVFEDATAVLFKHSN